MCVRLCDDYEKAFNVRNDLFKVRVYMHICLWYQLRLVFRWFDCSLLYIDSKGKKAAMSTTVTLLLSVGLCHSRQQLKK